MNSCETQVQKINNKFAIVRNNEGFQRFKNQIDENELVDVTFERVGVERSYRQIKKIHKLFRIIAEYTGHTVEEIKLIIKFKSGYAYQAEIDGISYVVPIKSIGRMSKAELSHLIEFTINYAEGELNLIVE